jgi:hypothetical protein
MRFMTASVLVGGISLASMVNAEAAEWTAAKFPGEQSRAVQGCADDTQKPGDWVCIIVRCDQPGAPLSLHFSAPGPDIQGSIKLVIDEDAFTLSVPASLKSQLPLSTRADAVPDGLIDAMKAGSAILIQGAYLKPPYNRISLESSRKAIERVERTCSRSYPSAGTFWRRIVRGAGFF